MLNKIYAVLWFAQELPQQWRIFFSPQRGRAPNATHILANWIYLKSTRTQSSLFNVAQHMINLCQWTEDAEPVITISTIMLHPPKKLWSSVLIPLAQRPLHRAHCELLDVANKEGSGSPHVILPALICIDFKQRGMSGKQSWPDFEEEADEHLLVFGLFCEPG